MIDIAEETLIIRHFGLSPKETLLMSAFSLRTAPPGLTAPASPQYGRSPTTPSLAA